MKFRRAIGVFWIFLIIGFQMQSQESTGLTDNKGWYQVEYLKFNPGKADVAIEIIEDYFVAASQLAGLSVPVLELELWTNDFDYMILWELPEEGKAFNWQEMPNNSQWYRALVTVAGSEDNAKTIIEHFDACVSTGKMETARKNQ